MGLGLDGKILFLLGSGKTLREIIIEGDYNLKAYIFKNIDEITKMIIVWRVAFQGKFVNRRSEDLCQFTGVFVIIAKY